MDSLITSHTKPRQNHQPKGPMNQIDKGDPRLKKALASLDHVTLTTETTALVTSSDGTKEYHITLSEDGKHVCECADNKFRGIVCWHIRATILKKTAKEMDVKET